MLAGRERRAWKKSGNMRMWMISSSRNRNGSQVRSRVAFSAVSVITNDKLQIAVTVEGKCT